MDNTEKLAYGHWTVSGTSCPIKAAGIDDREWASEVAEDFDGLVRSELDNNMVEGVISKEQAQQLWEKLKVITETNMRDPTDEDYEHMYELKLEIIQEVEESVFKDQA